MSELNPKNIPVLILAGGMGTRLSEETLARPKPMVEIGGRPILWHIMMYYSHYGFNDFVICTGYMAESIKEFFSKLHWYGTNVEFDYASSQGAKIIGSSSPSQKWRVRVIDTGLNTMTGGRVRRALDEISIKDGEHFALTYGDGLSNVNLSAELKFHESSKKIGTVAGVHPLARFGVLEVNEAQEVTSFQEKPHTSLGLINGGFFFFKSEFKKYLSRDETCVLERAPLENLARDRGLALYKHEGFWQCMDTLRDKQVLQANWDHQNCPWRLWKEGE